jgi:excisionase family DNA binding protein
MTDDFNPTEWITTKEAAKLTGYSVQYLRRLVRQERVRSRKWANVWMVDRGALLDYQQEMEGLGQEKHNPWRTGARRKDDDSR